MGTAIGGAEGGAGGGAGVPQFGQNRPSKGVPQRPQIMEAVSNAGRAI